MLVVVFWWLGSVEVLRRLRRAQDDNEQESAPGTGRSVRRAGSEANIMRTWGAAVLRPYTDSAADRFEAELSTGILRFARMTVRFVTSVKVRCLLFHFESDVG
jgi:hypothetical protein